jgi:hypothetical protein
VNKIYYALCLSMISFNALAINLQSFRFSDSYRYSLVEDSYQEKFKGDYVFSTSLGYTNSPFYVSDAKVSQLENEIINYQYILTIGGTWYMNKDLALGIDLNTSHSEVLGETYTNLADTILKARWNLYRASDLSFSLNPKIYLPTGNTEDFTTINSLGGSLNAVTEYRVNTWHFLGSLGYFHGDNNKVSIVDYRNLVLLNLAASYDLNQSWTVNGEAVKNFTTNRTYRQDEGDYYVTFKYKADPSFGLYFGAGIAGLDEIDRNNYTIFSGLKFHL